MATSSVAYNKPVLPRVSDTSDLASNRANVYSGKALSFDGVNDSIQVSNEIFDVSEHTITGYIKKTGSGTYRTVFGVDKTQATAQAGLYIQCPNLSTTFQALYYTESSSYAALITDSLKLNVWYHFAVTFDSGAIKTYLNGVLSTSASVSGTWTKDRNITIGAGWYNNAIVDFWDGQAAHFKVFDVALTATQVAELYNNPEQILPTGVSAVNLKLWLPMMEGAGSYVYNGAAGVTGTELVSNGGFDEVCQKWGLSDVATIAITGGKAVWTNPASGGAFADQYISATIGKTYRVTFDYSASDSGFVYVGDQYVSIPSGNGTFTTDITYTSGSARVRFAYGSASALTASIDNVSVKEVVPQATGTINGATWVAGLPEPLPQTALMDWNKPQRWTGSQMVTIGSTTVQTLKHSFYSRVTIDAYNTTETNLGSIIFMNYSGVGTIMNVRYNGYAELRPHCSTNGSNPIYSSQVIELGKTYDIVGVIDGTTAKLYINGSLDSSGTQIQTTTAQGTGVIGSWSSTNFNTAWDGTIHHVAYFDRALTSEEVNQFYQNTLKPENVSGCVHSWKNLNNWVDDKGVQNGTLTGTPTYYLAPQGLTTGKDIFGNSIAVSRSAGAFNFDGASWAEFQDNSSITISGDLTLEGWVYPTPESYTSWETLFSKTSQATMQLFINNSGILSHYDVSQGDTTLSSSSFNDNEWNHFAVVQSGSNLLGYVNGVLEVTRSSRTLNMSSAGNLTVGKNTGATDYHNGQIANPRIYNFALTAEQVADNYNQKATTVGATKTDSELQAYINRTVSAGATVEDHANLLNTLTELDNKSGCL